MLSININELKSAINFDIGTFFKSNNLETPFLIVLNPSDLDKFLSIEPRELSKIYTKEELFNKYKLAYYLRHKDLV